MRHPKQTPKIATLTAWCLSAFFVVCLLVSAIPAKATPDNPIESNPIEVKIGVLAKRGEAKTLQRWAPLATYLSQTIPGHSFTILPLGFEKVQEAVRDKSVEFVLVNPGMYIQLEANENVERIATMKNDVMGRPLTVFGGVVFTRQDREDIRGFDDLSGKKFAAVDPNSLGGWIAAHHEFFHNHIDPFSDFAAVDFLGTHDAVILAVLNGLYDAGTVRTDTLERMAAEQKINLRDIRLIRGQCPYEPLPATDECPFMRSTDLYPEWPMARLASTPMELSEQVAITLIAMPQNHPAAMQANIKGWTIPANYQRVHNAFLDLRLPPYTNLGELTATAFLDKFKYQILAAACAFLALCFALAQYVHLSRRLKASEQKLKTLATHDPLTGLPNRRLLEEYTELQIHNAERSNTNLGLLFVDLNDFKQVNDQHGHAVGDALLIEVALRLQSSIRKGDMVARCGGDEFQILLIDIQDTRDLGETARRILRSLKVDILIGRTHLKVGASIGIACYPQDGTDITALQKNADEAMYAAKSSARSDYRFASDLH